MSFIRSLRDHPPYKTNVSLKTHKDNSGIHRIRKRFLIGTTLLLYSFILTLSCFLYHPWINNFKTGTLEFISLKCNQWWNKTCIRYLYHSKGKRKETLFFTLLFCSLLYSIETKVPRKKDIVKNPKVIERIILHIIIYIWW